MTFAKRSYFRLRSTSKSRKLLFLLCCIFIILSSLEDNFVDGRIAVRNSSRDNDNGVFQSSHGNGGREYSNPRQNLDLTSNIKMHLLSSKTIILENKRHDLRNFGFILVAPDDADGIIMTVHSLQVFGNNQSHFDAVSTCTTFIEVTDLKLNNTSVKICGQVHGFDTSTSPSHLNGPRTSKYSQEILIRANEVSRDFSGKLVFTPYYTNCSMRKYYGTPLRSCSSSQPQYPSKELNDDICIPETEFCNGLYNCGNVSGGYFKADEFECYRSKRPITSYPTYIGNHYNYTYRGGLRTPVVIPILYRSPSLKYNPPKTYSFPKTSYSGSSGGKGLGKAGGKVMKFVIGVLAFLGSVIASIFGCKKKKNGNDGAIAVPLQEQEAEPLRYPPSPYRSGGVPINITLNPIATADNQDNLPSYLEAVKTEPESLRAPPPYSSC